MTIKYPRQWASQYNFLNDRVDIQTAIEFVNAVQSAAIGSLLEMHNQHIENNTNPDTDPVVQTERTLQEDLEKVKNWLQTLQKNGQQTISTTKIRNRIEDETGYDFQLTS